MDTDMDTDTGHGHGYQNVIAHRQANFEISFRKKLRHRVSSEGLWAQLNIIGILYGAALYGTAALR
jgi:hypothetical protein